MTIVTSKKIRYGGDENGRTYRMYPDPTNPYLMRIDVLEPDDEPHWERYRSSLNESDINLISYQVGIDWLEPDMSAIVA